MSFKDKLKEQYINPSVNQKGYGDLATIIGIDRPTNTVTIKVQNSQMPYAGSVFNGVSLPFTNGIESITPNAGDIVWVQYLNGDRNKPYIIATYPNTNKQYVDHKVYSAPLTRTLLGL
jgi:hypothetical protein